jgi:hypothetical protein
MYNYFSNKFENKLSYMEITKLQILFNVLHIVFFYNFKKIDMDIYKLDETQHNWL